MDDKSRLKKASQLVEDCHDKLYVLETLFDHIIDNNEADGLGLTFFCGIRVITTETKLQLQETKELLL